MIHARGTFENSTTLKLDLLDQPGKVERLTFEHCILATGSRPTKLPAFDLPTPRIMDSTGALELPEAPESLLVVGGGYIGLEMGSVYAELGTKVSVVELTDGLLPGADRDLVKPLHTRLEKQFAAIHLKTKVVSLTDKRDAIEVKFQAADGSNERTEKFSRVLVSVGRRPNSNDLGLENTEVELDTRGFVITDDQQRTADPHILAIGDVAGEPMLAHKASHQGKAAVGAAARRAVSSHPLAIPAVVFTDPEIAWAGLTEEASPPRRAREIEVVRYPWAASGARPTARACTEGLTKLIIDPESERVLGIGITWRRLSANWRSRRACWRSRWAARRAIWPNRSTRIPR